MEVILVTTACVFVQHIRCKVYFTGCESAWVPYVPEDRSTVSSGEEEETIAEHPLRETVFIQMQKQAKGLPWAGLPLMEQ